MEGDGQGQFFEIGFSLAFTRLRLFFREFVCAENDLNGMPLGHFSNIKKMREKIARLAIFGRHLQNLAGHEPLTPNEINRQKNVVADVFSCSPSKPWEEFDKALEFCRGENFEPMRSGLKKLRDCYLASFRIPHLPGVYMGYEGARLTRHECEVFN